MASALALALALVSAGVFAAACLVCPEDILADSLVDMGEELGLELGNRCLGYLGRRKRLKMTKMNSEIFDGYMRVPFDPAQSGLHCLQQ